MTSVSGISQVFDRSLVTYTYNAKMKELGVKEETLSKYTAEQSGSIRNGLRTEREKEAEFVFL